MLTTSTCGGCTQPCACLSLEASLRQKATHWGHTQQAASALHTALTSTWDHMAPCLKMVRFMPQVYQGCFSPEGSTSLVPETAIKVIVHVAWLMNCSHPTEHMGSVAANCPHCDASLCMCRPLHACSVRTCACRACMGAAGVSEAGAGWRPGRVVVCAVTHSKCTDAGHACI